MSTTEKPSAAFALSLVAGLLILVGSGTAMMWVSSGMSAGWGGPMSGMMGSWGDMMGGMGFTRGMLSGGTIFGLVSGLLVLVGALMLYTQPRQARTWGVIILVFSLLSLVGMGGFFIGAILGIVGGILALSYKP